MEKRNVNIPQTCIGMDLGDQYSHLCVLDRATGEVLEEARIRTTDDAIRGRFKRLDRVRVAIEVGSHSPWISRLLEELGHEVIVANSHKLRLIYLNDNKSDRVDAEYLAQLAATGLDKLLHPVRHRSKDTQAHRAVIVARDQVVECRTSLVNSARGLVKAIGKRLPRCSAASFHNKVRDELPEELKPAVEPLLNALSSLTQEIREFDKLIEKMGAEDHPETKLLRQVPGVGPITALNFVLTLEDPTRFESSRFVGSFVGLRPKKRGSSSSDPELRISKAGDPMLRKHLVQAAQYVLGPFSGDSDLKRWGLALAARGAKNAKKRAVVAVARKLSVLLHRLWISGQDYEPLRNANSNANKVAMKASA